MPSYVKVGIAEVSLLKKTMIFVLSVLSLSPLKRVLLWNLFSWNCRHSAVFEVRAMRDLN